MHIKIWKCNSKVRILYLWFQIDLGSHSYVYAVATQGYSSTYALSTYMVSCSQDGNTFKTVPEVNGTAAVRIHCYLKYNTVISKIYIVNCLKKKLLDNEQISSHTKY